MSPTSPNKKRQRCWPPPDPSTRVGRRDHALLLLALETGLRVSELTGLTREPVQLGTGAHVRCAGKGRPQRITPLRREARAVLRAWLDERGGAAGDALFPGPKDVDAATIALWLGHEDVRTTYRVYLHADLTLKENAIAKTAPPGTRPGRYRPPDALLAFLESL